MIPSPWEGIVLALLTYRLWRLFADDKILDRPRHWLVGLGWRWKDGFTIPKGYRESWADYLECPWCSGALVSLATYVAWWLTLGDDIDSTGDVFVGIGVVFALSAVVGLIRGNIDEPEE